MELCKGRVMVRGCLSSAPGSSLCCSPLEAMEGFASHAALPAECDPPGFCSSCSCFGRDTGCWGGSLWLCRPLSHLMRFLHDSPMQPTKTV